MGQPGRPSTNPLGRERRQRFGEVEFTLDDINSREAKDTAIAFLEPLAKVGAISETTGATAAALLKIIRAKRPRLENEPPVEIMNEDGTESLEPVRSVKEMQRIIARRSAQARTKTFRDYLESQRPPVHLTPEQESVIADFLSLTSWRSIKAAKPMLRAILKRPRLIKELFNGTGHRDVSGAKYQTGWKGDWQIRTNRIEIVGRVHPERSRENAEGDIVGPRLLDKLAMQTHNRVDPSWAVKLFNEIAALPPDERIEFIRRSNDATIANLPDVRLSHIYAPGPDPEYLKGWPPSRPSTREEIDPLFTPSPREEKVEVVTRFREEWCSSPKCTRTYCVVLVPDANGETRDEIQARHEAEEAERKRIAREEKEAADRECDKAERVLQAKLRAAWSKPPLLPEPWTVVREWMQP